MTNFDNVSQKFDLSLREAAKDHIINKNELKNLQKIAKTEDEKAIVDMLTKDNSNVSFKIKSADEEPNAFMFELDENRFSLRVEHGYKPLEIKKWDGSTEKNIDDFRATFRRITTKENVLSEEAAAELTEKVFGMDVKEMQELVGIKEPDNKFGPETLSRMLEHFAGKINSADSLEDCATLKKQFKALTDHSLQFLDNPRFRELKSALDQKTAIYIKQEIGNASSLRGLNNIRNELGTLFKSNDPAFKTLEKALNQKTQETISKEIGRADTEVEFKYLKMTIDGYSADKAFATGKFLNELTARANTYFDEKITNADTTDKTKKISDQIKEIGAILPNLNKNMAHKNDLKIIELIDKKIDKVEDLKTAREISEEVKGLKNYLGKGTYDITMNQIDNKIKVLELWGLEGIKGISPNQVVQGGLDDCFFLASVAGLAAQRPGDIVKMIKPSEDGKYFTVKFPGADREVTVSRPTDQELSKYATGSGDSGIWVAVLEKAYAMHRNFDIFGSQWRDNYRDSIDSGGLLSTGIGIFGNSTNTDLISASWHSQISDRLSTALDNKRIVTLSTWAGGDSKNNIPGNHVYTVLKYDKEKDLLTIRNPWGPQGEPKLMTEGDKKLMKDLKDKQNPDGTFTITMNELNKYFSFIGYEQGK